MLSRLAPVLIALLAPPLLHEPHSRGVWLALPACLAGVVCMARPSFLFGGSGSGGGKARVTAGGLAVGLSQVGCTAVLRVLRVHSWRFCMVLASLGRVEASILSGLGGVEEWGWTVGVSKVASLDRYPTILALESLAYSQPLGLHRQATQAQESCAGGRSHAPSLQSQTNANCSPLVRATFSYSAGWGE